jgi:hypothetical protein
MARSNRAGRSVFSPFQLAQNRARDKAKRKAFLRRKKDILWNRSSNSRAFHVFWLCVLATLGWLGFASWYF